MIAFVLLILLLLFFNQEMFGKAAVPLYDNKCQKESFTSRYIAPFHEDDYNYTNPDMEYYFDKTGRKGTMFRMLEPLEKEDLILTKKLKKKDYFNAIVNKLELYNENIYNNCNSIPSII
jgi:hypothetical protein